MRAPVLAAAMSLAIGSGCASDIDYLAESAWGGSTVVARAPADVRTAGGAGGASPRQSGAGGTPGSTASPSSSAPSEESMELSAGGSSTGGTSSGDTGSVTTPVQSGSGGTSRSSAATAGAGGISRELCTLQARCNDGVIRGMYGWFCSALNATCENGCKQEVASISDPYFESDRLIATEIAKAKLCRPSSGGASSGGTSSGGASSGGASAAIASL